jgi:predicted nucleic acid-binding Zn ribbon protein
MDQASRIIAQWQGVSDVISAEQIACGSWKRAVGKRVAAHTRALKLVRTTLVVEVEDELWQRNLWKLRYQVLRSLEKAIGSEIVSDLEFRIMPQRREPQRDTGERLALAPLDEADAIADPGLRRVYRTSRRRETA